MTSTPAVPASRILPSLLLSLFSTGDGFPARHYEPKLVLRLWELGYDVRCVNKILEHVEASGTVEDCDWLYDHQRDAIEALLPWADHSAWALHDRWTWEDGGEA